MSVNFPSSQYKYSGQRYNFTGSLFIAEDKEGTKMTLDPSKVTEFSYVNRLGDMCLTGELCYMDDTGQVINYVNSQYVMLEVAHTPLDEKFDGSVAVQTPRTAEAFAHVFLVTNLAIVDRKETSMKYRMQLISQNWFDCVKTIDYTNYADKPVQIYGIIKACMQAAGLEIDADSFDVAQSAVKLNYITNGNDNLFTILKYLFNKTCYYDDRDGSMRFVFYDELARKYGIFDMSNMRGDKTKGNKVVVSMDKSSFEKMTAEEQTQFASVVQLPKTNVFRSLFNRKINSFDYSANDFTSSSIETNVLANLYNSHGSDDLTYKKLHGIYSDNDKYVARSSIWSSTTDIYREQLKNMFDNNALVVNTVGVATRQPGDTIEVVVSKDRTDAKTDGMKTYEDWQAKYRELNGLWVAAQVRHMVSPAAGYYRQNLVLFKNFIEKKA